MAVNERDSYPIQKFEANLHLLQVAVLPLRAALSPVMTAHRTSQRISRTIRTTACVYLFPHTSIFLIHFLMNTNRRISLAVFCFYINSKFVELPNQTDYKIIVEISPCASLKHSHLTVIVKFCCTHTQPKASSKTACWEAQCY